MGQGRLRRAGVALSLALLAALAFGGTAGADRPWTWPNTSLGFSCESTSEQGTVVVEGTANADGSSFVGYWAPGTDPASDPATLRTDEWLSTVRDGWRLSGQGPINDGATGEVVGEVSFALEMTPVETETLRDHEKEGSRIYKVRGISQTLEGAGSAVLPDFTVAVEDCVGSATDLLLWGNSPRSIQGSGRTGLIDCMVTNADGYRLHLWGDDLDVSGDVYAPNSDEKILLSFAHDDAMDMLDVNGFHKPLRVHDRATGEYLGDTVNQLSATTLGRARTIEQRFQDGRQVLSVQDAALHGTITFPTGLVFDMEGCTVSDIENRLHVSVVPDRADTRAVPPNDAPGAAQPLRVGGRSIQAQTGGAALDAELPSACEGKGEYYGPMGRTVWYSVTGTGLPLTVDTTGSDFDTVVAVYTADAATGALAEVACADDLPVHKFVDVPQAKLSFETEPGAAYFVQVGGFGGESGRLTLTAK